MVEQENFCSIILAAVTMKEDSRRQFLHCGVCLAASGPTAGFFPGPAGCEEENTGASAGKVRPGDPLSKPPTNQAA